MMKNRSSWMPLVAVQLLLVGAFGAAYLLANSETRSMVQNELPLIKAERFTPVPVDRKLPIPISRPYQRDDLISDEDLAMVLDQIQPIFDKHQMKPNFIEHALRTWGVDATFQNPKSISGADMLAFLTDSARFADSWGKEIKPFLEERPRGIGIHWGTDTGASYHHDHLLACVTEANAPLDTPIYGPSRRDATLYNVLQESMRDFRLDERETEWTAMAFGLWICPEKEWIGAEGRHYSFDLLAERLMRGERTKGVCAGTHRVYSLMLLLRLDDDFNILSPDCHKQVYHYLEGVRDAISASQFAEGYWPTNWPDGKAAVETPIDEPEYRRVIATGHHLEWMSIAPRELLIPDDQLKKAMDWCIATTRKQSREDINKMYTFYTHIGSALSNWRQVRAADYWREWEQANPYDPSREAAVFTDQADKADQAAKTDSPAEPASALESAPAVETK